MIGDTQIVTMDAILICLNLACLVAAVEILTTPPPSMFRAAFCSAMFGLNCLLLGINLVSWLAAAHFG